MAQKNSISNSRSYRSKDSKNFNNFFGCEIVVIFEVIFLISSMEIFGIFASVDSHTFMRQKHNREEVCRNAKTMWHSCIDPSK